MTKSEFPISHVKTLRNFIVSDEKRSEINNREMFHTVKDIRPSSGS